MVNWICHYCAHRNNEIHENRCSNCNNLNNDRIIQVDCSIISVNNSDIQNFNNTRDQQWYCLFCTYLNKSTSLKCEICEFSELNSHGITEINQIINSDEMFLQDDFFKDQLKADGIRNTIVSSLINIKFTDFEFPASIISIGIVEKENSLLETYSSRIQNMLSEPIKWLRPEFLQGDEYSNSKLPWAVVRDPSSDDIVQGKLGNCWLLTGLALIADRSSLLDRILINRTIDPYGIYQIRLCNYGMWKIVTVDDLFPANQFDRLIYSRANRKQLWVSLIEKAAAKLYGSYQSLTLGYCADGLSTLTGYPCETIKLSGLLNKIEETLYHGTDRCVENGSDDNDDYEENVTADTIWAMMLSAQDANFFICVSCGSQNDEPEFLNELNQLGLRNLHAYAILDIKDIPRANLRLLRLKNPWACMTWKGMWSDLHECWNTIPEEIRNEIQPPGVTGESCGIFWISWTDVLQYFFALDICRYHADWCEIRMQTHLPWPIWIDRNSQKLYMDVVLTDPAKIYADTKLPISEIDKSNTCAVLTVLESAECEIVLWQSNCRSKKSKPVDILIVVCCDYKSPIGKIIASSKRQSSSYVTCNVFLDKGVYTVFYISLYYWQCHNEMNLGYSNSNLSCSLFECTLSIHSSKPVLLNKATLTPEMIPQVISELTISKGRMKLFGRTQVYTLMKNYAGMIMVIVNPSDSSDIRCISDCSGSVNLRNSRGLNVSKSYDVICPGFKQIIIILTQNDADSSYSLQHKCTTSSSPINFMSEFSQFYNLSADHWPSIQSILHQPMYLC